ncbi:beta-ketoacyl synthase chain length factor [bacterium]|nr:beta-ketoacyl synthase chain length factor [bacterium]
MGNVSPQETLDKSSFLEAPVSYDTPRLKCIPPPHKEYIPARSARRMGQVIRNSVVAAKVALADAGIEMPGAIITGTGLGCVENTDKFLFSLIENEEQLLNPTPFIQSTHNTVAGQIALLTGCTAYNATYAHRGFSFGSSLLDAWLMVGEGEEESACVGGVDEITEFYYTITQRLGFWKEEKIESLLLKESRIPGTLAGEGAAFFVLSGEKNSNTYACISGIDMFYKPKSPEEITERAKSFLHKMGTTPEEIDMVVYGICGDPEFDSYYLNLMEKVFPDAVATWFKHLVGEYMTATAFAMWMGAKALKTNRIPTITRWEPKPKEERRLKRVLVYNHYRGANHTFILLEKCD